MPPHGLRTLLRSGTIWSSVVIPEPSIYAALAGVAVLGLEFPCRRRY